MGAQQVELWAELSALRALRIAIDAAPETAQQVDEWLAREQAFLERVVALPASADNVAIKASAVVLIHNGDPSNFHADCGCTDAVLARQALWAIAERV